MTACTDETGVCERIVAAVDTVADDDQCCSYTSVAAGRHCLSCTTEGRKVLLDCRCVAELKAAGLGTRSYFHDSICG